MREYNFEIAPTGLRKGDTDIDGLLSLKNLQVGKGYWSVPKAYTFPWAERGQLLRGKSVTLLWKEGDGEGLSIPDDAIRIYTLEQLQYIGQHEDYPLDAYYLLMSDIDASETEEWNDGEGFVPIGGPSNQFSGTFNGAGHTISNLWIERGDKYNGNNALFSWVNAAGHIFDLFLNNCTVLGGDANNEGYQGGLHTACLAACNSGLIERCAVNGTTRGYLCGLLVGWNDGTILNCRSTGQVYSTTTRRIGGLVGQTNGIIRKCYAAAEIILGVGDGDVNGGLVGMFGILEDDEVIPFGEISDSYYDSEVSGMSDTGKGIPKTTAEMQTQETFVGWDFENTWGITDGYPYLISRFEFEAGLDGFYTVNESTLGITGIKNSGRQNAWQMADYGPYAILSDGSVTFVYSNNAIQPAAVRLGAVCARDARLVYGDVSGAINGVGWSTALGEDIPHILAGTTPAVETIALNESGFAVMPFRGRVHAIVPMGDHYIVYGADGIAALKEVGGQLAFVDVAVPQGLGIYARGAVAGDNQQHLFRGSDGALWMLGANLQAVKLDYGWALTDQNIVLHDPLENLFWIVGPTDAYVLTESGLGGPIDQAPTSVIPRLGIATGTPCEESIAIEIKSNTFDMGRNSQKRVNLVNVNGEFSGAMVSGECKYTSNDTFRTIPSVHCSPEGAGFVRFSFVYGRLTFTAVMTPQDRITRFEVRYQPQDWRFIRGTTAVVNAGDGDA